VIARLALGLGAVAVGALLVASRCKLGIHRYRQQFVGDSWNPDAYVKCCVRCGQEPTS
jgi:hypothetical protein